MRACTQVHVHPRAADRLMSPCVRGGPLFAPDLWEASKRIMKSAPGAGKLLVDKSPQLARVNCRQIRNRGTCPGKITGQYEVGPPAERRLEVKTNPQHLTQVNAV